MNEIKQNISTIHQRINSACTRCGRESHAIKLLLTTKTVVAENILVALQAGETLIGENKVQELKEKFETLQTVPHQTHFIGHLQSNKIKEVLKYMDCIQSVDRIFLANKLQKRLDFEDKRLMSLFK